MKSIVSMKVAHFLQLKDLKLEKMMKIKGIFFINLGMNGLKKLSIDDIDLPSNDSRGGIRILNNSTMINPTYTSIELGKVQYKMLYNNKNIKSFSLSRF